MLSTAVSSPTAWLPAASNRSSADRRSSDPTPERRSDGETSIVMMCPTGATWATMNPCAVVLLASEATSVNDPLLRM